MEKYHSFDDIQFALKNGKSNCRSIVSYYLQNIQTKAHLNAFVEVYAHSALEKADQIDQKIAEGKAGKLAGMVIGIKDVLNYEGHACTAGSKILTGYICHYTATAVQRLLDEDAIVIGRLNCDEFGMGSSNEHSIYGKVFQELDPTRVPGGSSGGSAVAVQANLCTVSLGSDTGGSVRQPAAFTGVIGMKPTYSRVSRWGLIAYASSFDTIGVFSTTILDNARVLEVMAGYDPNDSTSSQKAVGQFSSLSFSNKPVKVAVLKEAIYAPSLQPEIKQNTLEVIGKLKKEGHEDRKSVV